MGTSEYLGARGGVDGAEVAHLLAVDVGRNLIAEVLIVLNDPGDVEPAQWTRIRIELSGSRATLFVGDAAQPVLIVTDLKRGPGAHGTVGLYVDNGTDGHFSNLRINPR